MRYSTELTARTWLRGVTGAVTATHKTKLQAERNSTKGTSLFRDVCCFLQEYGAV